MKKVLAHAQIELSAAHAQIELDMQMWQKVRGEKKVAARAP